jgi:hypothetical protein
MATRRKLYIPLTALDSTAVAPHSITQHHTASFTTNQNTYSTTQHSDSITQYHSPQVPPWPVLSLLLWQPSLSTLVSVCPSHSITKHHEASHSIVQHHRQQQQARTFLTQHDTASYSITQHHRQQHHYIASPPRSHALRAPSDARRAEQRNGSLNAGASFMAALVLSCCKRGGVCEDVIDPSLPFLPF